MNHPENTAYSENIQMYLVEIQRRSGAGSPLPLPRLAEVLGISVPSVNEMVKKLAEHGFVDYVPYAGVRLTDRGEDLAGRLLRKHRLWEVFLVEELNFEPEQAHQIACQLEHATPDTLAERLNRYLESPRVSPMGEPIPSSGASKKPSEVKSLAECAAGDCAVFRTVQGPDRDSQGSYLEKLGLNPGMRLRVLADDPESLLIRVGKNQASLAREFAAVIIVQECAEENLPEHLAD